MKRPAKTSQSSTADLVQRIQRTYQKAGLLLDLDRLERVKSLPEKYLNRLLDALTEMANRAEPDPETWYAAIENKRQAHLNEMAIAAIGSKADVGADKQAGDSAKRK